ncbi:IS110 family transposase [Pannonibacter sp. SL95]|uniref:IS110 family transposase n=1 Tax=Pannonibacter sp. SL95 TaxID=2995153 RepID=UPI002273676B|nr:IS110 family transposase [Pannonibacter sp. SL95]MCY1707960.1 IS110 family transposase [Pannonibacter sp. SL95]MCY1708254.1 IS110 family transposase [Pannonibacter sp. SL95]MCY1708719.1 IS110 family transposase [Pannonibacter sp. SL95]
MPALQQPPAHVCGFDVAKDSITAFDTATGRVTTFPNRSASIRKALTGLSADCLCVLEPTGGHERLLVGELTAAGLACHRADTVKVKAFSRSFGRLAKTDAIDAQALARYGEERWKTLALFTPADETQSTLASLNARRQELLALKVAEQNRSKIPGEGPGIAIIRRSCQVILRAILHEIEAIDAAIEALVDASPQLARRIEVCCSLPGVGKRTAITLAATMPELGTMDRRQAASLAGVAPHPKDSGTLKGYRRMHGGRSTVKPALFMAALSASRANGPLKEVYQRLINNGKKPILAIAALMRKIIVILNARIRHNAQQQS